MRNTLAGVLGVLVLVMAILSMGFWRNRLYAQLSPSVQAEASSGSRELIALSTDTADARQLVVVIDCQARVMSVYHVEHATGKISLKSVRNIRADLLMDEFNTESPLPREIRAILKQR